MSARKKWTGLAFWVLLGIAVAALGGLASASAGTFYAELSRPGWSPPGWLFGPVWTVLYLMMSVAAWLVWLRQGLASPAIAVYLAQLAANALWSWLFFAWRLGALAFIEILVLWLLIVATIVAFHRVRPLAGWLLVPYLAWVTFASVLCFAIWRANPEVLG